jgi:hypothetical protein
VHRPRSSSRTRNSLEIIISGQQSPGLISYQLWISMSNSWHLQPQLRHRQAASPLLLLQHCLFLPCPPFPLLLPPLWHPTRRSSPSLNGSMVVQSTAVIGTEAAKGFLMPRRPRDGRTDRIFRAMRLVSCKPEVCVHECPPEFRGIGDINNKLLRAKMEGLRPMLVSTG